MKNTSIKYKDTEIKYLKINDEVFLCMTDILKCLNYKSLSASASTLLKRNDILKLNFKKGNIFSNNQIREIILLNYLGVLGMCFLTQQNKNTEDFYNFVSSELLQILINLENLNNPTE